MRADVFAFLMNAIPLRISDAVRLSAALDINYNCIKKL